MTIRALASFATTTTVSGCSSTTLRRTLATGTRGARGHGWYVKYKEGLGGRHLQGPHPNRNVDHLNAMNQQALDLGSIQMYLELTHDNNSAKTRIDLTCAAYALPKTTKNFELLCEEKTYLNSLVYRFQKDVGFCLGDYIRNTGKAGACHPSVTNMWGLVDSEPLVMSHTAGTISLITPGVDKGDSRFMLITHDSPHLEGRFVPFGKMTEESLEALLEIENKGIYTVRGRPILDMFISDCGVVYHPDKEPLSASS